MIALIVIAAFAAGIILGVKFRDADTASNEILSEVSRDGTHTTHTKI
jgi:hypothetical protein